MIVHDVLFVLTFSLSFGALKNIGSIIIYSSYVDWGGVWRKHLNPGYTLELPVYPLKYTYILISSF